MSSQSSRSVAVPCGLLAPAGDAVSTSVRRITPRGSSLAAGLREIWEYRELLYLLTWRDIRVRYTQTVLGAAWAILQPVALMLLFTAFFGRVAKLDSNGLPYFLIAYAALVPWQLFSSSVASSTESIVANERVITKVYFPRVLLPLAAVLAAMLDFLIAFLLLLLMMAVKGITPSRDVVLFPLFVVLALVSSAGVGIWIAALNAEYRDVRYVTPFLLQALLFATPVVFSSFSLPPAWQAVLALNPMTAVVEGFRWTLLQGTAVPPGTILLSILVSALLLVTGLAYFGRVDERIADVV
jgi:lipopolysaccharide transport system permease protein